MISRPSDEDGEIAAEAAAILMERVKHCDALILGPGMSISPRTDQLVAGLLTEPCPQRTIVLDAAAMTSASELAPVIARPDGRVILTPHPGELAHRAGLVSDAVGRGRSPLRGRGRT